MRRYVSWPDSVPELAVTHASNWQNGDSFVTNVEAAMSTSTRSVTPKRASPGQGTPSSRSGTSRSQIEPPHPLHHQRRRVPACPNASNLHPETFTVYRSLSIVRSKSRLHRPGKICCTHGKLCCSDQQSFPSQLAETLVDRGVGTAHCIPKNIPTKKHSYSLPSWHFSSS